MRETLLAPTADMARDLALRQARRSTLIRHLLAGAATTVIGLIIFLAIAFPNLWLLSTSIKDTAAVWAVPPQYIPLNPTLENYQLLLSGGAGVTRTRELEFWYLYVLNSTFVAAVPAVLATLIGTLAGYGFARFAFPGATTMLTTVALRPDLFPGQSSRSPR
jgi:multiple sugar transport system permease protein